MAETQTTEMVTEEVLEPAASDDVQAELERVRAALKKANAEAAQRRKQLEQFEAEAQARREAEMTALEKAQAQAQEAEAARDQALQQANDRLIRAAFVAEAARAGAAHPDDVYHLADLAGVSIGDDSTVTGVAEAVKTLVDGGRLVMSGRPQAPGLDGGAGSGQRASEKPVPLSPEQLAVARKMGLTPEQYRAGMPQTQQQ